MTKITNKAKGAFTLPLGMTIPAGQTVDVANWEKQENNPVVRAWLASGYLEVGEGSADEGSGNDSTGDDGDDRRETLALLTVPQLVEYIEKRKGTVKRGASKDELVQQALTLPEDEPA